MSETVVLGKDGAGAFVRHLLSEQISPFAVGILFGGDRWSCIDEAVVIKTDDQIVGMITIAPKGEEVSGQPTLVGLYVLSEHRRKGFGRQLTLAAIDRCRERGLIPVRVDTLTTPAKELIESLPAEYQTDVKLVDMSNPMMDSILLA